jgi:hypothetical protein
MTRAFSGLKPVFIIVVLLILIAGPLFPDNGWDGELEGKVLLHDGSLGVGLNLLPEGSAWRAGLGFDGDAVSLYRKSARPEPVTRNWEIFAERRMFSHSGWSLFLGGAGFFQTLIFSSPLRLYISTFVTAGIAPRISLERRLSPRVALYAGYFPKFFYSSHADGSLKEEFELDLYPVPLGPHLYFQYAGPVQAGVRLRF